MKKYNKANHFEKVKAEEEKRKKEQELAFREMQLEMREKLLEQDRKIDAQGMEFKKETMDIRQEVNILRLDHESLKKYVESEFVKVYAKIDQEIANVTKNIEGLRVEVRQGFADMKLWVGQEINRIDNQQMKIVNALERYANQVQHYRKESEYIKKEANQMQRDAKFILQRADHQYKKVQYEEKKLLDTLKSYQGKMAVNFEKQKMLLDDISLKQHYALRDIGIGKMGVQVMQKELSTRATLERERISSAKRELQTIQNNISRERSLLKYDLSNQKKISALEDKLKVTQDKLTYWKNIF